MTGTDLLCFQVSFCRLRRGPAREQKKKQHPSHPKQHPSHPCDNVQNPESECPSTIYAGNSYLDFPLCKHCALFIYKASRKGRHRSRPHRWGEHHGGLRRTLSTDRFQTSLRPQTLEVSTYTRDWGLLKPSGFRWVLECVGMSGCISGWILVFLHILHIPAPCDAVFCLPEPAGQSQNVGGSAVGPSAGLLRWSVRVGMKPACERCARGMAGSSSG